MTVSTAGQATAALLQCLADLADAEGRYRQARAAGRARHPDLPPRVADLRTRSDDAMRIAISDWQVATERVRAYGAAASALLLHEFLGLPAGGGGEPRGGRQLDPVAR